MRMAAVLAFGDDEPPARIGRNRRPGVHFADPAQQHVALPVLRRRRPAPLLRTGCSHPPSSSEVTSFKDARISQSGLAGELGGKRAEVDTVLLVDGINADQMLLVTLQPARRGGVSRYRVAAQDCTVSVCPPLVSPMPERYTRSVRRRKPVFPQG